MCGIAAILSSSDRRVPDLEMLGRMNAALVHRGPDGEGARLFAGRSARVALGHRRLSIIDLEGGAQPMSNEDGTLWISYNGEIYNHEQLRRELVDRGHHYRSRCDTETIVHAYEEWGADCVLRLRGMFAFVIWDSRAECLFGARDRLGIKPFYYSHAGETLLCASEMKALFASGWRTPELNLESLPAKLALGYLADDATMFRGIQKLLPGHRLLWQRGRLKIDSYWDVPLPEPATRTVREAEFVEEFLERFEESVRMRLMSDVPLGVFLSGGLDSSAIAATMARQISEPLKTFSVGFEANYFSEFEYARELARSIGADHHEVVLKPARLFASLPNMIWHEEEPIRNPSSIALAAVSDLARQEVKVVLTGEGSDELFAGYERYWATLFNLRWGAAYERLVPAWVRESCIRRTLWSWPVPLAVRKKLSHTFLRYSLQPEAIVFENWHSVLSAQGLRELFTPHFRDAVRSIDPFAEPTRLFHRRASGDVLDQLLYTDQKAYLAELLRKQDTMSMSASIESRVPFLDHPLVEFAAQVPANLKIRGTQGKYLVKQAMRRVLPQSILRRKKMGFPVPIGQWFREAPAATLRSIFTSRPFHEHGLFDPAVVIRLLDEHTAGRRDHADALWTVLNFELWMRVYLDRQQCDTVVEELAEVDRSNSQPCAAGVAWPAES